MSWKVIGIAALVVGIVIVVSVLNRKRVLEQLDEEKLSENFSLAEFVKTATGLDNIPNAEETENLRQLVINILQPLRTAIGKPVIVTSGFRSALVNQMVGGAGNSQHTKGQAADIQVEGMTNGDIITMIRTLKLKYDQVIDETNGIKKWVHVSYSGNGNRGNWLTYNNGVYQTISKNYA